MSLSRYYIMVYDGATPKTGLLDASFAKHCAHDTLGVDLTASGAPTFVVTEIDAVLFAGLYRVDWQQLSDGDWVASVTRSDAYRVEFGQGFEQVIDGLTQRQREQLWSTQRNGTVTGFPLAPSWKDRNGVTRFVETLDANGNHAANPTLTPSSP